MPRNYDMPSLPDGIILSSEEHVIWWGRIGRTEIWATTARVMWRWTRAYDRSITRTIPMRHVSAVDLSRRVDRWQRGWGWVLLIVGLVVAVLSVLHRSFPLTPLGGGALAVGAVVAIIGLVLILTAWRSVLEVMSTSGQVGLSLPVSWSRIPDMAELSARLSNATARADE